MSFPPKGLLFYMIAIVNKVAFIIIEDSMTACIKMFHEKEGIEKVT